MKPEARLTISRDEIRAVYAQGEAAVIELVESLVARINQLEERVEALENQQSKNSRNSSKPPSGDGFGKRTKSLRRQSDRSSGGQPGHPGHHLEWCDAPTQVEIHPVHDCAGCGLSLEQTAVVDWDVRQVEGKLMVDKGAAQFMAEGLIMTNGQRYALDAISEKITTTETIRKGASATGVIKGAALGSAAAAGVAAVTGDRNIKAWEVLAGTGAGALAGLVFSKDKVDLISIKPNTDLAIQLNSELVLPQ